MLPEIPVEAESHGDPIAKLRPFLPADGPVGPSHPGLPGGETEVSDLLERNACLRSRFLQPDQEVSAVNSFQNATFAGVGTDLQAHLIPRFSLHWSCSQVELFAI